MPTSSLNAKPSWPAPRVIVKRIGAGGIGPALGRRESRRAGEGEVDGEVDGEGEGEGENDDGDDDEENAASDAPTEFVPAPSVVPAAPPLGPARFAPGPVSLSLLRCSAGSGVPAAPLEAPSSAVPLLPLLTLNERAARLKSEPVGELGDARSACGTALLVVLGGAVAGATADSGDACGGDTEEPVLDLPDLRRRGDVKEPAARLKIELGLELERDREPDC